MFPRTIQQQAQTNNMANGAYKPLNPAHYAVKEREPQIIRISSQDSRVQTSLMTLEPNFSNIAEMLGTRSNDIYFQFRSFRFFNRFYNVSAGDYIDIRVGMKLTMSDNSNTSYLNDSIQDPLVLQYPVKLSLTPTSYDSMDKEWLTGDEMSYRLNISARQFLTQMISCSADNSYSYFQVQYPNTVLSKFEIDTIIFGWRAVAELLQCSTFSYDSNSNKMCMVMSSLYAANPQFDYTVTVGTNGSILSLIYSAPPTSNTLPRNVIKEINIYLSAGQGLSQADQFRISVCFGMNRASFTLISTDNTQTIETFGQVLRFDSGDMTYVYARNEGALGPPINSYDISKIKLDLIPTIIKYFDDEMSLQHHDHLRIKTSLRTNIIDEQGRRSDDLTTVPLQFKNNGDYVEYVPGTVGQRTYNGKDTLSSLKSFYVHIVDNDEQAVQFLRPWELQIAVFFSPDDPMLQAM